MTPHTTCSNRRSLRPSLRPSLAVRLAFAGSLTFAAALLACGGGNASSSDCIPGASVACTCASGAKGAQVCNANGKSLGSCECGASSDVPPGEGADASSSHPVSSSSPPAGMTGTGAACSQASDCPELPCACSNGSDTSYQACNNGFCALVCPTPDVPAGGACLIPSGCFCASQGCAFGAETCCASTPVGASGTGCATDCDCVSGDCVQGSCF